MIEDIWTNEITKYIETLPDWFSFILICRDFSDLPLPQQFKMYDNHLWKAIRVVPGAMWHLDHITYNPNTSPEVLAANPRYIYGYGPWSMSTTDYEYGREDYETEMCSMFTWLLPIDESTPYMLDEIKSNPDGEWTREDYHILSLHPKTTWEVILDNLDIQWLWNCVSRNRNITGDIIENNPDFPWDFGDFSLNPSLTWQEIRKNKDVLEFEFVSMNRFGL